MGGPASLLLWNICYDPIVAAAAGPAYVDDLAQLTAGAGPTIVAHYTLLCAGARAGLRVGSHSCQTVRAAEVPREVVEGLAALPVTLTCSIPPATNGDRYRIEVRGLPSSVLCRLGVELGGQDWCSGLACHQAMCNCTTKTALVPAGDAGAWQAASHSGPFGSEAVKLGAVHLGAWVTGGTLGTGRAGAAARQAVKTGTWQKPTRGVIERATTLGSRPGGLGLKAWQWNIGCASMTLHAARICPPPTQHANDLLRAMAALFRTQGWAPAWLPCALRLLGVRGAPRCPGALAMATGAAAARLSDSWAGGAADAEQAAALAAVRSTASRAAAGELGVLRAEGAHVERWLNDPAAGRPGGAMYCIALCHTRWAPLRLWLNACSQRKRWLRPAGEAFRLAKLAKHYTAASHIVRLLAGGHWPGGCRPARGPHAERTCARCGHGPPRAVWLSPAQGHGDLAWCCRCSPPWDGKSWIPMPRQGRTPPQRCCASPHAPSSATLMTPPGLRATRTLCGIGEAGSEHLLRWCPAVASAWARLCPGAPALLEAVNQPGPWDPQAAQLIHQASFLHASLLHRSRPGWARSARLLCQQARTSEETGDDGFADEWDAGGSPVRALWHFGWEGDGPGACEACRAHRPHRAWAQRAGPLAAPYDVQAGDVVISRHALHTGGIWPVKGSPWAPPSNVDAAQANARWIAYRCGDCDRHWLRLAAVAPITAGTAVLAAPNDWIVTATPWDQHLYVFGDGSYRASGAGGGKGHGGAAAIAFRAGTRLGSASLPLPSCESAAEAEAHGVALGLGLAQQYREWGSVTIVGDCSTVMAHCAGKGRARDVRALKVLQAALAAAGTSALGAQWACINRADNAAADAFAKAARKSVRPTTHARPGPLARSPNG